MGNLTKYRKQNKMKISELAEKVGVSGAAISRYERGKRQMTVEMAKKIATVLNVENWWELYD